MPIPPPAAPKRSSLTKEQKQQELDVIYGVNMPQQLTAAEIERMRSLIQEHDASDDTADFDPSKVKVPYQFQKFPMMVYNHERSYPAHSEERTTKQGTMVVTEMVHVEAHLASKIVKSERDLEIALNDGWSQDSPVFEEEAVEKIEVQPKRAYRKRQVA